MLGLQLGELLQAHRRWGAQRLGEQGDESNLTSTFYPRSRWLSTLAGGEWVPPCLLLLPSLLLVGLTGSGLHPQTGSAWCCS